MKKFLLFVMATFVLLLNVVSVNANENVAISSYDEGSESVEPRWWPGNPNPEPGSEAWLQLYGGYKPSSSAKARECALKALAGNHGVNTAGGVAAWVLGGVFTVASFVKTFGIAWGVPYLWCILGL